MTTKGKMYGFWIITRPGTSATNGGAYDRTPVYIAAESEQRAEAAIPELYGPGVEFERMTS